MKCDSKDFVGGLGDIDVQFKSLLYDFVSKETSDKVRDGYEIKKAEGVYYSRCASYGYVIDETLPTRIRVDEEAAEIVRYIFKLRREGLSTNKIAKALNGAGVKVPSVYLNEKFGVGKFFAKSEQLKWSRAGVSHILCNEIYAGTFVYGKYRTEIVGSRKPRLLPKSEWKRIPNHHEPIVSMEEFLSVQDENATFFGNNVNKDREKPLFGGIVTCGQCGCNLEHQYSAKGRNTYRCKKRYVGGENTCESYLFADNLEEAVKGQPAVYLSKIKDMSALLGRKQENLSKRHKTATTHLYQMEDTKRRLQTDLRDAYEAYVMKVTDKETYLEQMELYEGMLVSLDEKLKLQK